jgi:hypothetical protein
MSLLLSTTSFAGYEVLPQFPEDHKLIAAIKAETDPVRKESMMKGLENICPFKDETSDLGALIPGAITMINLSSNLSEAKKAECMGYLNKFNESIYKTNNIQRMVNDSSVQIDQAEKIDLENKLQNTITATASFSSMLQTQCEFEESDDEIAKVGSHLTNAVETSSNALFFVNPIAALIGATAAATGRMVTSLGSWLFGKEKNKLSHEAAESESFINDLCSFRGLAQKYDKLFSDPFDNNPEKNKERQEARMARDKLFEESRSRKVCEDQLKTAVDMLQTFSAELAQVAEKPSSQKQCLNLLNKYIDTGKSDTVGSLQYLAKKYGCPNPEQGVPTHYLSYCKNLSSIDSLAKEDIYDKCEKEDFQKLATAKFTNLSDILFRSVQAEAMAMSPTSDQLQINRQIEARQQMEIAQYDALLTVVDANPVTNTNTSKSMTDLGRTILGRRFDKFAKNSISTAENALEEASDLLDDLVEQKNDIEGIGMFNFGVKDKVERAKLQKEICDNLFQVKRELTNAYQSYSGVKDVCDFMKGEGVPPLKAKGFSYDNYSKPVSEQDNNLTSRCVGIYEEVTYGFTEIKDQTKVASTLGCGK